MAKYNTLNYKVFFKDGDFELRKYADFFIVEYESKDDPNIEKGFSSLFRYISSDNEKDEKISMTTPVLTNKHEGFKKIAFVALDKNRDSIPNPNNPNINIEKVDSSLFATVKYGGYSNKDKESLMKDKLKTWIKSQNCQVNSDFMYATYNAPFKPFNRRNEIWVKVIKEKITSS